ncbi:Translation machinery-associated protein 20 [Durusdinium trenchii]|uniref:Translation machinery-associated protein 20 n=1 Tax=Durusdinium trenchii TaxID=1381693 RepID=A0ABP0Q8M7_9DINO
MFKGFTPADVSGQNQVKSSVQRGIKQKIQEQFPRLEPVFKEIWPKDCLVWPSVRITSLWCSSKRSHSFGKNETGPGCRPYACCTSIRR